MPSRLEGWDYGAPGAYFITACTYRRRPVFGVVEGERVLLSALGALTAACVSRLSDSGRHVALQAAVVMPDHVHLLIDRDGTDVGAPTVDDLVRAFKARTTHGARRAGVLAPGVPLWQRGFFDRIVRSAQERTALVAYIETNPWRWTLRRGGVS
ncbi:transposase [Luteitalea sp.]|uniref:transposase n=1 Tax=Luteitalea sp. TaxID=2004800 RepID=UPI0025C1A34E|nr:transposase [Luteitalea sp.]